MTAHDAFEDPNDSGTKYGHGQTSAGLQGILSVRPFEVFHSLDEQNCNLSHKTPGRLAIAPDLCNHTQPMPPPQHPPHLQTRPGLNPFVHDHPTLGAFRLDRTRHEFRAEESRAAAPSAPGLRYMLSPDESQFDSFGGLTGLKASEAVLRAIAASSAGHSCARLGWEPLGGLDMKRCRGQWKRT